MTDAGHIETGADVYDEALFGCPGSTPVADVDHTGKVDVLSGVYQSDSSVQTLIEAPISLDFEDPLTLALFDRTPQQRAQFGGYLVEIINQGLADSSDAHVLAAKTMHVDFLHDIDALRRKNQARVAESLGKSEPSLREDAAFSATEDQLHEDLRTLHHALPLPMIERLAVANA